MWELRFLVQKKNQKSSVLQYLKMRKTIAHIILIIVLIGIVKSAIIITSSLPQVYQINSKQALIVFDEPEDMDVKAEESENEDNKLTEKKTINALLAAAELGKIAQSVIKSVSNEKEGQSQEKKIVQSTPALSAVTNSSISDQTQNSSFTSQPTITSNPMIALSASPPLITSSSNPSITASSGPAISPSSVPISIPQEILKYLNSSSSSSTSYSSTTKTTFSSTTITTNYGVITTNKTINHIKMSSSFGSLGSRADEEQYRNLVKSKNAKWISQQSRLTFKLAENQFTHLTIDQFRQLFLNLEIPKNVGVFDIDYESDLQRFFNIDSFTFDSVFGEYSHPSKKKSNKQSIIPPPSSNIIPNKTNSSNTTSKNQSKTSNSTTNSSNSTSKTNSTSNNSSNTSSNSTNKNTTLNNSSNTPSNSSNSSNNNTNTTKTSNTSNTSIIINVDWTTSGVVSSIKDQGSCGGCYAFATNAAIQSAYLMKNYSQYSQINLSVQQILDCSVNYGNKGCNGGWISNVLDYGKANGITTQAAYPYTQTSGNCKINGGAYKISSYAGGALTDCNALAAMVTGRPTSIAVSAGTNYWMAYAGGILNQCGTSLDHGVLLVGVFQNASMNYWKIKNSWGTGWGENGFIRVDRSLNNGNLCSICSYGYYPII